jgi:tetratricopeptide (TPR) repeat protein
VHADQANQAGDYERAMRLLDEAIEQDSTFAMAYRKLGVILENQDRHPDRAREAFTKAYEFRDRLTERERYLAEATYHSYVEDDPQAAADVYRTLLQKYSTDRIALNNLAVSYGALDRMEEATDLYLQSIALGGAPAVTYTNAIRNLYLLGLRDSAARVLDAFETEFPDQPEVTRYRAHFLAARYDYAGAEELMLELQASQRGNPSFELTTTFELAGYAAVQGRATEALRTIREGYDLQERYGARFIAQSWELFSAAATGLVMLRYYGARDTVLALLEELTESRSWIQLPPADRDYLTLASIYAEAGEPESARALVARYESEIEPEDHDQRGLHVVRGTIALAEERPLDAVEEFRAFRELVPGCLLCGLFDIGRAYEVAGRADSAIAYYQRYLDAPELSRSGEHSFLVWDAIRRLGSLYEVEGDDERAIDYYDRFIALWENAEPRLQPQVQDVRERLARLAGEQP